MTRFFGTFSGWGGRPQMALHLAGVFSVLDFCSQHRQKYPKYMLWPKGENPKLQLLKTQKLNSMAKIMDSASAMSRERVFSPLKCSIFAHRPVVTQVSELPKKSRKAPKVRQVLKPVRRYSLLLASILSLCAPGPATVLAHNCCSASLSLLKNDQIRATIPCQSLRSLRHGTVIPVATHLVRQKASIT